MTPMKLTVTAYITQQIQAKQPKPRGNNKQVKPTVYGEVLTRDDIVARLEEQEKEKQQKRQRKKRKERKRRQREMRRKQRGRRKERQRRQRER